MNLIEIKSEVNTQLSDKETFNSLLLTTFKGINPNLVKRACMEGMMRGFTFADFLQKNIYAVPFGQEYSLVTSIDHARKIGMRSGVIGKSAPVFTMNGTQIESCSVTIKRTYQGVVGEYTSTVFFDEYSTGRNLWKSKPRTMIAKVAEMHALRMACPEEMASMYSEDEIAHGTQKDTAVLPQAGDFKSKLEAVTSLVELKTVWANIPATAKPELKTLKEELKKKYENK